MNKEQILKYLFSLAENNSNRHPLPVNEYSTLPDLFEYQLDINFFLSDIDLDFWVDLDEVYGVKLLTTHLSEIAEYLEKNATHQPIQ